MTLQKKKGLSADRVDRLEGLCEYGGALVKG